MIRWLAFLLGLALATPAAAEGWVCRVLERSDPNRPANLEVVVQENRTLGPIAFYLSWVSQPGHMAEQQYSWVGIPANATLLWQPDQIEFGIRGRRTDPRGWIAFKREGAERISMPARQTAHWLKDFRTTWVNVSHGIYVAPLWAGKGWTAEAFDRRGRSLGSVVLLLPDREAMQALFARMKGELDRKLGDPAHLCDAIPDPTPAELEQQVI